MKKELMNVYIGKEHPYLRPFICRTNPYESKICIVGINPATSIMPCDMELKRYIEVISNYSEFMKEYKKIRLEKNKKEISRTRVGIDSFADWVKKELNQSIIEADICTYPTNNIKELLKLDKEIIQKSINLFIEVLKEFKPEVIILYGAKTVQIFRDVIEKEKLNGKILSDSKDISVLENCNPFAYLYIENKRISVFVAKHFMYYGRVGNVFENLRNMLKENLK